MNVRTYMRMLVLAAMLLPGWAFNVFSQSVKEGEEGNEENIVERIRTESNGNVIIEIDQDLLEKILTDPEVTVKKKEYKEGTSKGNNGYRIQIFSDGRNQSTLEARAKARGSAIIAKFPKYRGQVYTFSSSPNWYTRIGNFRSEAEANKALDELRRTFPQFSSEMRVVKSKISTR